MMFVAKIAYPKTSKSYSAFREPLALKLRRNWLAKHATTQPDMDQDDSLTNLDWLLDLNMTKVMSPNRQTPSTPKFTSDCQVNPNAILDVSPSCTTTPFSPRTTVDSVQTPTSSSDYKNDPRKPPYSYAKLIASAIRNSDDSKSTLSGIYNWITDNFMYYRMSDTTWHNSIRHNLSLNKSFMKVPRRKDEPGKGGFWTLNPEYADQNLGDVLFKKRNWSSSTVEVTSSAAVVAPIQKAKRIKLEKELSNNPRDLFNAMTEDETHDAVSAIQNNDGPMVGYVAVNTVKSEQSSSSSFQTLSKGWNAILHHDIDVGGVRIKNEDIIDDTSSAALAITSYSPPPSEHSSGELLFNDLLKEFDPHMDDPLSPNLALDMSLPKEKKSDSNNWWQSMNDPYSPDTDSRMSTPTHSSSDTEFSQTWNGDGERANNTIAYFDNIFDMSDTYNSQAVCVL
ncbi:hypothetical protein LSH36_187g05010 [Paralvinella palmiformis]|uniref:Fork-head domain-containing protein n=1 Tax=Paralvinella palmiformis TaxID=53620 RepID=A0AAD9JR46_9ANNE|nr:hypothetical protein LSH36_187g05010 [Paralvinella palmiformis]